MSRKLIGKLAVAAALCVAAPAWAHHDGHGYVNSHRHWKHGHASQVRERVVVREYVKPIPVYSHVVYPAYPAPAPGIHIVLPDLFISFH